MFFISVVWKLSVDLRPQESKGLKGAYSLKFFYLDEDEKFFYRMVCKWQRCNCLWADVDNDHCASYFGIYSHDGNEEWIQCPALCQQ